MMIEITDKIREQVLFYLGIDIDNDECMEDYTDSFYAFYYRCMTDGMDYFDADRYATLNTLFDYDIGVDNAKAIDHWMYEHDEEIFDLNCNKNSKAMVSLAVAELGLDIDFSGWIEEDYEEYSFF